MAEATYGLLSRIFAISTTRGYHDDDHSGCVKEPIRSILRLEAFGVLVALVVTYWRLHASWLVFMILIFSPDVAMVGYLRGTRLGAWCYNAFHTYTAPLVCLGASLYLPILLPIAIVWAAHIAMDRALGFGLKYEDAFRHTHLSIVGNQTETKNEPNS